LDFIVAQLTLMVGVDPPVALLVQQTASNSHGQRAVVVATPVRDREFRLLRNRYLQIDAGPSTQQNNAIIQELRQPINRWHLLVRQMQVMVCILML
jgi:hypothetical protein